MQTQGPDNKFDTKDCLSWFNYDNVRATNTIKNLLLRYQGRKTLGGQHQCEDH